MRDLELWRRLDGGTATAADLAAVASLPLARRSAYVGHALRLTTHADAEVRAAALRLLGGARGIEGVRAIVASLEDADEHVREAAIVALRELGRDAPVRYAHALFHGRPEVRRAALDRELTDAIGEIAIYLRADEATADLAAVRGRWPTQALWMAFAFHASGHVGADELVAIVQRHTPSDLQRYFEKGDRREGNQVSAFLDAGMRGESPLRALSGRDVIDALVAAYATCSPEKRNLTVFLATAGHGSSHLARRATASLLAYLVREPAHPELWGLCIALEPRLLALPQIPAAYTRAIREGIASHRGMRLAREQLAQLFALPMVKGDLALVAVLAGRASEQPMRTLGDLRGEDSIVESLVASDHGWLEICRLPHETPARDQGWLARIEKVAPERYVALAGIAMLTYTSTRQQLFIEQLPRKYRSAVFRSGLFTALAESEERRLSLYKAIAPRIDRTTLTELLPALLDGDASGVLALGVLRHVDPLVVGAAAKTWSVPHVVRLTVLADTDPIPRDREIALAEAFHARGIAEVADWCARATASKAATVAASPMLVRAKRALTVAEERAIRASSGAGLDMALAPALAGCVTGLVRALTRAGRLPHVRACAALLACADPLEDIARVLDQYSEPTTAFDVALDNAMTGLAHAADLPPLAQARLWRWERQLFSFLDWVDSIGGPLVAVEFAERLATHVPRTTLWQAVSEGLMLLRYRDRARFAPLATPELAVYCAMRIDTPVGRHAARILVALVETGAIPVSAVRDKVLDRIADADGETRSYVARLIRIEGVPEAQQINVAPPVDVVDDIRRSTDVAALARWCLDIRATVVQEAALALVALGPPGQLALAQVLTDELPPAPVPILATLVLWDHPPALDRVRTLWDRPHLEPSWQFHLALALLHRGEGEMLPRALAAVRATSEQWYFRRTDWDALVEASDQLTCALALTDAPHHHAYTRAVNVLLSLTRPTDDVREALVRFLEVDSDRPLHLRTETAHYIARHFDDTRGLPLLVDEICEPKNPETHKTLADVPDSAVPALLRCVVDAALVGGDPFCSEPRMWLFLNHAAHNARATAEALSELRLRIFEGSSHAPTRRQAAVHVMSASEQYERVRRVAEVFAWGVRRGVELAGRLFTMHITSTEKDLGHTRLDGNHIHVSPLPMLRNEPHGRDIVEGLVLHEIGHHVYHRSEKAQALWKRAHHEGIGHFLNLIADEHLERNLRALDPSYGDRLKRLGAYAFHHAPQEIALSALLDALGPSSAPALIAADLGVAYDEKSVRMRRGAVLAELDRLGHPVARFSRALRMGLGNRAGDPLNAAALALCGKELRALDMQGLYDLTRRLVDLFGGKVEVTKVFGGPEGLVFGERDADTFAGGIEDDLLQKEIERILEPGKSGGHGGSGRLAINVNPSTHFDKIGKVVRVTGDPEAHRALSMQVARHSSRLRGYLDELGLRWEPARARTQGRALDRTRLRALVTRNDPRILVARTPTRKTDLFLGVIVDCSGSMQVRDNIGRARRFAVLVAEAVRNLPGVEARFFGFTDSVIYDAGTKNDCQVTGLVANGGNNDAAALFHAAEVAMAAPQRAKVLMMISDGLPTECSVAALRNLVTELTRRRNIVCAQVGVIPLEEICFPHYVLINDDQLDVAVAKFGRMIADLARRSLAS